MTKNNDSLFVFFSAVFLLLFLSFRFSPGVPIKSSDLKQTVAVKQSIPFPISAAELFENEDSESDYGDAGFHESGFYSPYFILQTLYHISDNYLITGRFSQPDIFTMRNLRV